MPFKACDRFVDVYIVISLSRLRQVEFCRIDFFPIFVKIG